MTTMTRTIAFGTLNPRRNLPVEVRFKRGELLFQSAFLRAWQSESKEVGVGGGQFELPELGIADYLWASSSGRLDAFEFKLTDWRKGATQAMRYRSYAHRVFLVMPPVPALRAAQHLEAFRDLEIGLWAFHVLTGEIERHFTPAPLVPLNSKAHEAAISILSRKRKFREMLETA